MWYICPVLWQPLMWPGFSRQERVQEGVPNNCVCCSQHTGYSPKLLVSTKSYTPNNLNGKYFKLVETFLIVVVSQNVSSAEIDNPFFYKVFQLAPGWWFCKEILPWWVVEFPIISIACLQIPPLCRGGNKWLVHKLDILTEEIHFRISSFFSFVVVHTTYLSYNFHAVRLQWKCLHGLYTRLRTCTIK